MAINVSESDFDQRVIARSRELPVVVDFWAEWCGPCRTLGPALEREAAKREGSLELVKLDTDANQALAARYGIRSIPAVKAFRDGEVVDEFVGAIPPPQVERFFDGLVPSEADELAGAGDEDSLRRALEADPDHAEARRILAGLLLRRGEAEEASELLRPISGDRGDFVADGLLARAELSLNGAQAPPAAGVALERAFEAWDGGDVERALEALQEALVAGDAPEWRDSIRRVMVAIFTELGAEHPLAREHRRRLSAALN
jgi:putative thioredoxin